MTKKCLVSVTVWDLSILDKGVLWLGKILSYRRDKRQRDPRNFLIAGTHIDLPPRVRVSTSKSIN